jgi:hypothetical protein
MASAYRASVLREIGISDAEAARVAAQCQLRLPAELSSDVAVYVGLLGPPLRTEPLGDRAPKLFPASTEHVFILPLWPHLFWIVNSKPGGGSWGVGFRNQVELGVTMVDPRVVRPGVWTRHSLEGTARRSVPIDGWDEEIVLRLEFSTQQFEARFVFGLLQEWVGVGPD